MSKFVNPCKVITGPNTRWSYANVWEARSINGGTPKFSVSLIIPKTDTATIEKINRAIQAAYEEGQSKLKGTSKYMPSLEDIKNPLRDDPPRDVRDAVERPLHRLAAHQLRDRHRRARVHGFLCAHRQQECKQRYPC